MKTRIILTSVILALLSIDLQAMRQSARLAEHPRSMLPLMLEGSGIDPTDNEDEKKRRIGIVVDHLKTYINPRGGDWQIFLAKYGTGDEDGTVEERLRHLWASFSTNLLEGEFTLRDFFTARTLPTTDFFRALSYLPWISTLDLYGNSVKVFATPFQCLVNLTRLDLEFCELRILSPGINQLVRLESLDLTHNKLKFLPDSIGALAPQNGGVLRELCVGDNPLSSTDEEGNWGLTSLQAVFGEHLDEDDE